MKTTNNELSLITRIIELQTKAVLLKEDARYIAGNMLYKTIHEYYDLTISMYRDTKALYEEIETFYHDTMYVENDDDYTLPFYRMWSDLTCDTFHELEDLMEYYEDHRKHLEDMTEWARLPL